MRAAGRLISGAKVAPDGTFWEGIEDTLVWHPPVFSRFAGELPLTDSARDYAAPTLALPVWEPR